MSDLILADNEFLMKFSVGDKEDRLAILVVKPDMAYRQCCWIAGAHSIKPVHSGIEMYCEAAHPPAPADWERYVFWEIQKNICHAINYIADDSCSFEFMLEWYEKELPVRFNILSPDSYNKYWIESTF